MAGINNTHLKSVYSTQKAQDLHQSWQHQNQYSESLDKSRTVGLCQKHPSYVRYYQNKGPPQQHHERKISQGRTKPHKQYLPTESPQEAVSDLPGAERLPSSRTEEDRKRRTILVEKENGSFGFTIQSYGIHYKRNGETETITYVDFVEYAGSAYRAGMREGDVILSINGHDMERADHKHLVNFIHSCGDRLRMIVLFEDCVKKVELHMRYIKLQRLLHEKISELECLCHREKALLSAWWSEGYNIPRVITGQQHYPHYDDERFSSSVVDYCKASKYSLSPTSPNPKTYYVPESDSWNKHHLLDFQSQPFEGKTNCRRWTPQKPRSWENLLSHKTFGNYGFGYGYIDSIPSKGFTSRPTRLRSVSSYRLQDEKDNPPNDIDHGEWNEGEGCSTMPRSRYRSSRRGSETLVSPLGSSTCFSCDCLSVEAPLVDGCMLSKPRSTESLLAPKTLRTVPSETSIATVSEKDRYRRTKTVSLANCLGKGPSNEQTHL